MATAEQCTAVRLELKEWEKQFAALHGGRKASREDIRADTTIAPKYKEYNRLRDELSGKAAVVKTAIKPTRKRRATDDVFKTPSKRRQSRAVTPTHDTTTTPAKEVVFESPSAIRKLLTPTPKRTVIGPTPQKDGMVLGLFDLLSQESPVKKQRTALGEVEPNLLRTPSKPRAENDDELGASGGTKLSRTPMSAGRRYLLDTIVTPMKRKRENEGTPSASAKHLATPSFLRRDSVRLETVLESDDFRSNTMPWKRKPFGRSLSSMIKGLRKQETDRLDEDLDILRELEQEEADSKAAAPKVPEIVVVDSQADMKLGPDGFHGSDSEKDQDESGKLDENGKPRKVWKKKGLKRQTRRVLMRPVRTKPKLQQEPVHSETEDDGVVEESQITGPRTHANIEQEHEQASDDDASEYDELADGPGRPTRKPQKSSRPEHTEGRVDASDPEKAQTKKKTRKTSALAHANFRKLKIKNKNSKGQGRGRFGRGRR